MHHCIRITTSDDIRKLYTALNAEAYRRLPERPRKGEELGEVAQGVQRKDGREPGPRQKRQAMSEGIK